MLLAPNASLCSDAAVGSACSTPTAVARHNGEITRRNTTIICSAIKLKLVRKQISCNYRWTERGTLSPIDRLSNALGIIHAYRLKVPKGWQFCDIRHLWILTLFAYICSVPVKCGSGQCWGSHLPTVKGQVTHTHMQTKTLAKLQNMQTTLENKDVNMGRNQSLFSFFFQVCNHFF